MKTDTPETDNEADDAHNLCLDYDCQGKNDNIPRPIVVPADFARKLERERDALQAQLREEMKLHVQTLTERDVWKYNAGIVDEERKAENQKAIALFIELHELRFAVKTLRDAPSHQLLEHASDHLFSLLP